MEVAIIGYGGNAHVLEDILKLNNYKIIGYFDDNKTESLGKIDNIRNINIMNLVCSISNNIIRKDIIEKYNNHNWINVIHPSAIIADNVEMGKGNMIYAGVIIQPNTKVGNHTIINTKTLIEHDCNIGNYIHIAPNSTICGFSKIKDLTFIGAGTTIINNKSIGYNSIIGAGSLVLNNINDNLVAYGHPCKVIKNNI